MKESLAEKMQQRLSAHVELEPTDKDFARGLLVEIVAALRRARPGERIAFTTREPVDAELDRWAQLTGNAVVGVTREPEGVRYVVRHGAPAAEDERPIGSRVWLYTNFDCNLACDYCCVRSSPRAPRRALGLDTIRAVANEARALGVEELFVTGGEPFLLADIGAILAACAEAAKTTVLTNGMLFAGKRRAALEGLPRDRVAFQISVDSPDAELHDRHRGAGSWDRAVAGARIAREEGFRVRIAATVETDDQEERLRAFFDRERVAPEDRIVRRVALRGFAAEGVALARADLVPEPTVTASGVYWHPVGATDDDMFVTAQILPLASALDTIRRAYEDQRRFADTLASIFFCA